MAKSLSERIAERARKKKPSRNAQNRAAFLAIRVDVKQALDDGWPVKSVWETLHEEGKVTFSYQAFRGYVNRLILASKPDVSPPPATPATPGEGGTLDAGKPAAEGDSKTTTQKPAALPGFTFNANPDKKDLL
ncbi:TraK family protein [Xanthomonas oryzae]|uniref:TraK family protein n=1 Tax=Xanthomonas oryzae TaxID=347 RepID=UPI00349EC036